MAWADDAWNRFFSRNTFLRNYDALAAIDDFLAGQIRDAVLAREDIVPVLLESGLPSLQQHYRGKLRHLYPENPYKDAELQVENLVRDSLSGVLLVGLGFGYGLEVLMKLHPHLAIWIVEPDAVFYSITLSRISLSEPLLSGQLRFSDGSDLDSVVAQLPADIACVVHPGRALDLRWEVRMLETLLADRQKRPPPLMKMFAIFGSSDIKLRAALVPGNLLADDLAAALLERNHRLQMLRVEQMTDDEVLNFLQRANTDLVFSINYVRSLDRLCAQLQIPYIVWEIDPRVWALKPPTAEERAYVHLFVWRAQHVARYRALGFRSVHHLPLAANPEIRRPLELNASQIDRFRAPISFVGASLIQEGESERRLVQQHFLSRLNGASSRGDTERWARALEVIRDALDAQASELFRPVFSEMLESGFRELDLPLEIAIDGGLLDLRIAYGRAFGARRRSAVVNALSDFQAVVYGDARWKDGLNNPEQYHGIADHDEELTAIYNASEINLDIGRLYQLDIVTMRVFDILASGGFVLAEASEELPLLFTPGKEIVSWSTVEELREHCAYYLNHPKQRLDLIEAGRNRVLNEHTVIRRLDRMLEVVSADGALGSRAVHWH